MNETQHSDSPTLSRDTPDSSRRSTLVDLLLSMRAPDDIDITADEKKVAFVVWARVPGEQKRRGRIWIAQSDGEAHPFATGKDDASCPRWSPDGKQLAFITKPEGEKEKPQLHTIAAEGGEPRLLCTMPNGVSELSWAPDGSRIAFISLEGKEPQSDPKVLAPSRHRRLWMIHANHTLPEPVTPPDVTVWEYAWAPDSKQLALYYSTGPDDTDWYHSQIGVVASNGGAVRQLTQLSWQARGLAWSPDGQHIAYLSGRWSDPGRGSGDIHAVTLENGHIRNLTPSIDCSPSWCRWLPDGRHLLFTAVKNTTHQIGLLDTHKGAITVLADDFVMQYDQPQLSITADCRSFATVHSTSQQPPDLWYGTFTHEGTTPTGITWKKLSRLNPIVEETLELAKTERIRYESIDGWLVDGLFMPPHQTRPGELPPLYVEVHGGPSGTTCDTWDSFNQVFAAEGFAIFQPNMRGSWGQGMAFADAVLGDMGGKDFQDILNGVEYLVKQGKVDGNRVCIGGWSNGGFLTAWAVTQTNRFKAAMVGAGITDWHNMHAQTNIADADILLLATDPLKNPETYRQRSPLTFAERVTTPTLIIHGEDDPAVPVAQAYAFYRALRERGVPVECVIYPREGHGLSELDHVRDYLERNIRWFKQCIR